MTEEETTLRIMSVMDKTHEDCDCLIWHGATNGVGHPKMRTDGMSCSVRRFVWELHKGELEQSQLVTTTCGQASCLNPAHLKLTTKSKVSKINNARPDVKMRRAASAARTNQAKFGKLSMEIAREIRESEKDGKQLAAELGVHPSLISKVRQGRAWVDRRNPFMGLMAA